MRVFFRQALRIAFGTVLLAMPSLLADTPITLGSVVSGVLEEPGAQVRYTFTGSPGQRIVFDALNGDSTSIVVTLTAPSGTVLPFWNSANVHNDIGPVTLPEVGAYTLLVDGSGAAVGPYAFSILDTATAPVLPQDSLTTETLSPGNSARIYRLEGAVGQRLYFDGLGANAGGTWYLYGPAANSQPIVGTSIGSDFEVTLTQSGPHLVILYGTSASPVIYSFQAVGFSVTSTPLSLGGSVAGTIAKPGDQQAYTFEGSPGQRVLYDALDSDFIQINARLLNPSGLVLREWNSDNDVEPMTLNESGTYSLVLDGIGAVTGPFQFRVSDVASLPTLALDTVITDTLVPGLSARAYRFEGAAGQRLFLDGLGVNSGGAFWLYSPANVGLVNASIGGDFEFTLTQPGRYVLVAWGTSASGPLPFSFQVVTSDQVPGSLATGTVVSGSIAEPGQQHLYAFTGSAGQRIYYDGMDGDGDQIYSRLVAPNGGLVWDFTLQGNDVGPITLQENGQYTLLVDGSGASLGDFRFRILDLAAAPPLALTGTLTGSLNPSTSAALYQHNGVAGQRIQFDNLSATLNQANWRLVGPANQNIAGPINLTSDLGSVLLPVTGLYVLLVEGYSDNVAPLQFQFTAVSQTDTPVATTGLGVVREGTIAAGQSVTHAFTAPAGLWVYYDAQNRAESASLVAELQDPTGAVVFTWAAGFDSQGAQGYGLPRSGTYQLIVKGNSPAATGAFRYRMLDLVGGIPAVTLGATVTGNLDPGYRTDVYQFTGQPGQRCLYDGLENDFASVTVRLMMPDGQIRFLQGNADQDVAPFTLPVAGTYRLFFENQGAAAASYSARLLDLAAAPPLPFESIESVTLDPGLGATAYRFEAPSGQRMFFDGFPTSGPGTWYLYGPANEQLTGSGFASDFEIVTTSAGRYALVLYGSNPSTTPVSFEVFLPDGGTPGGGLRITALELVNDSVTVTWDSSPGQTYRLQSKPGLNDPLWTDVPGDVTAAGSSASKTDTTGGSAPLRFHRVITVP